MVCMKKDQFYNTPLLKKKKEKTKWDGGKNTVENNSEKFWRMKILI